MGAVLRLIALVGWSFICAPAQAIARALNLPVADRIPRRYHAGVCRIFGIQIAKAGRMRSERPTLFVANHISYLDIFVLGAVIEGSFVAKAEVAGWPVAGYFAKLQRTIFVERERRASTGAQRDMLQQRLEERTNVILFPEGTSHDGARVLPFKSALFAAAEREVDGAPVIVQPVSIAYVTMDGLPLTRAQRSTVAWYGDMGMVDHLWAFLKASRTGVTVQFHEPVSMLEHQNRRRLAAACHETVAHGVNGLVYGREPARALPPPERQELLTKA